MKKSKLAAINVFIGLFSQIIVLALGFVVPKIIINNYGSDTNGLTNTISQIFTYIGLLEAGIGQATQNALYPVLKKDNHEDISKIMSISRRYYRKISVFYAIAVLAVAIVLPFVLKTSVDFMTIFFYVLFEGLTSLVGFYFTGLWSLFLNTSGKTYFTNIVSLLCRVLQNVVKIILALNGVNILFIQLGYFAVSLVSLAIYGIYMKKKYGWIDYSLSSKVDKLPDRNAYIVTEIAGAIFSGTDMIVLSIMVSTSLSSVYSVYNMVFLAINALINGVYNAIKYILGLTYAENIEKYKKVHDAFNSLFLGAMTICMCVSLWLTLPFVNLYTKGVSDINYIYEWLPFWFSLVQMLSMSRFVAGNLSGIAGYAKQVSYASLTEAIVNIIGTVVLVYFFGIYGAIIATVVALPIKVIYVNYIAEKKIMKRSPFKTLLIFGINYLIFAGTAILCLFYKPNVNSYGIFIAWGFGLTAIYTVLVFGLNVAINKDLPPLFKMILKKRKEA